VRLKAVAFAALAINLLYWWPVAAQVIPGVSGAGSFASATIGTASPTPITNIRVYTPTCTPVASTAAIQTLDFSCAVTGITTADKLIVNPPSNTSLCPLVNARPGTNAVILSHAVLTAAICTPAAGTYAVVAIRS
jgi:hypothetical protein